MEVTPRYTLPTLVTLLTLSCRGTQQAVYVYVYFAKKELSPDVFS